MSFFSYKIEHDFGLAPNPFGGFCTLAVCKSSIRSNKNLAIGDWIFGTGSAELGNLHKLIFAMQVEEKLTFNQYWNDPRFQYKKPILNGSLVQMYGDNIYHQDPKTNKWIQSNSAHSHADGTTNEDHLNRDISGQYVLISKNFYYFGDQCIQIKEQHLPICNEGRDMKRPGIPHEIANDFVNWLQHTYAKGIHGDPINWKKYNLGDINYGNLKDYL